MNDSLVRFVPQSVIPLGICPHQESGLLERIELCGRVAYKSEDKITESSALEFVARMKQHGHLSVLEHSNIVLAERPLKRGYVNLYERFAERGAFHRIVYGDGIGFISGNLRAWLETIEFWKNAGFTDLARSYAVALAEACPKLCGGFLVQFVKTGRDDLYVLNADTQLRLLQSEGFDLPLFTFKVVCDRGISHELVRHRVMSFTQESTRYVNYGNKGVTYIMPEWLEANASAIHEKSLTPVQSSTEVLLQQIADQYTTAVETAIKPQIARDVLPNLLKTELYMTGRFSHWQHFVLLRESKAAHPRVQKIAAAVREYFEGIGLSMG